MEWEKCKKCGVEDLILPEFKKRGVCIDCHYKRIFWIMGIIMALVIIPLVIFGIVQYLYWEYPIQRDVWDVLDRAQITAESDDMLILVNEAKTSLENKIGLFSRKPQIDGNCALIFKKPSNSLTAQYLALTNIKTRLERTNTFDKNSVEYQSAIDDIRGTIREIKYLDCWIWHWS